ncbi:neuropeptide FF receptor 1-like [Scylla paramamosain]|uniref:neuropeptide FF receptor 1-like n=1 Tax=Scylla paramamosain TaxID=85552 RepID=UPI003083C207
MSCTQVVMCGLLVLVASPPARGGVPCTLPPPASVPSHSSTEAIMKNSEASPSLLTMFPTACGDLKMVSEEWVRVEGSDKTLQCLHQLPESRGRVIRDVYWFASRSTDIMVYLGNSSEVVLTWDYLTAAQKAWEVMSLVVVVVGLVAALLGNSLVLVTMLASGHSDALWIMRASLAASDLLRAVTVMVLAVHDTISLMTRHYDANTTPSRADDVGFVVFVGVMFWITTLASVQCLAWLSVERVLLCGFPHVCSHLTVRKAAVASVIVWLLAAFLPLVLFLLTQGPVTYWDPATKLTFLLPGGDAEGAAYVVLVVQYVYLIVLSLLTAAASGLAVCVFQGKALQENDDAERHTPASCVWRKRRDDQTIHFTLFLMLITFLLSVPPFLLSFLLQYLLPSAFWSHSQALHCILTWLFVFSSSWQWYVYNLRSNFFRSHVATLLLRCVCLPECLKKRLRFTTPSTLSLEWGHAWYDLHAFIRRKSTVLQNSECGGVEGRQEKVEI